MPLPRSTSPAGDAQRSLFDHVPATPDPALDRALIALAKELGAKAGADGVTIADLRHTADHRGLQLPERPHFLGALMKRAGLHATRSTRRSTVARSHGNRHTVWVLPEAAA